MYTLFHSKRLSQYMHIHTHEYIFMRMHIYTHQGYRMTVDLGDPWWFECVVVHSIYWVIQMLMHITLTVFLQVHNIHHFAGAYPSWLIMHTAWSLSASSAHGYSELFYRCACTYAHIRATVWLLIRVIPHGSSV
jgi:hypothetical protein